jgi:hypothetical protein
MKPLNAFYDYLMPELGGITTPMLDQQLRMVARDYCERTRIWRGDFDPVNTVAALDTYDLNPGESQADTVQVHKLTVNDQLLFDDDYDADRWTTATTATQPPIEPKYEKSRPPFSVTPDFLQIVLIDAEIPDASVTGGLVIVGSMKPTVIATQLPDLMFGVHLEAFRVGVLSRLMLMAGKPWSAAAQGGMYRRDYETAVQNAANDAQRNNTRALMRTRPWG